MVIKGIVNFIFYNLFKIFSVFGYMCDFYCFIDQKKYKCLFYMYNNILELKRKIYKIMYIYCFEYYFVKKFYDFLLFYYVRGIFLYFQIYLLNEFCY